MSYDLLECDLGSLIRESMQMNYSVCNLGCYDKNVMSFYDNKLKEYFLSNNEEGILDCVDDFRIMYEHKKKLDLIHIMFNKNSSHMEDKQDGK